MKATFNAVCSKCGQFKPRCARVNVRAGRLASYYTDCITILCTACRQTLKGLCRLADEHKGGGK